MVDKVKSIIKKAVVKMTPFVVGVKVKVKEVVVKMFQNKLVVAVLLVLILSFFIFFFIFGAIHINASMNSMKARDGVQLILRIISNV